MEACRFCYGEVVIKSGFVRGKQRYKCKTCGKHYIIDLAPRGVAPQIKIQALLMIREGMGFRATARILGVSLTAVLNWFKDKALMIKQMVEHQAIETTEEIDVVEIDEMWHYTQKNAGNYGCGLLLLVPRDESSPSKLVLVGRKHLKGS